ncbi:amidohydrolase family protein [Streptomyces sp. NPDC056716]|uniref:amidohydrolase family protein n=1 Tax=unclassified Streptomyces TaxID=2593676 RepID=UPI0036C5D719
MTASEHQASVAPFDGAVPADLIVEGARVASAAGAVAAELVDVVVRGGRIAALGPGAGAGVAARERIAADGGLVTAPFTEPHSHPDKALSRRSIGPLGLPAPLTHRPALMQRQRDLKATFTREEVADRAGAFLRLAAAQGVGTVAGQADIDTVTGLTSFEGVMDAREAHTDLLELRVTAFPQEGLVQDPGAYELVAAALAAGAHRVGGWPNNERSPEDQLTHLDQVFELAERFGVGIDINVDYFTDPTERLLLPLAERTLAHGMQGLVNANHVGALETYSEGDARQAIEKVAEAGITVTVCPTNLSGSRPYRGVSRAAELLAAGVTLAAGTGNLQDNWEPFGNLDPLDTARLAWHAVPLADEDDRGVETAWRLVTDHAARAAGVPFNALRAGEPADFVVLAATSLTDALRNEPGPRWTVRGGRIAARRLGEIWTAPVPAGVA